MNARVAVYWQRSSSTREPRGTNTCKLVRRPRTACKGRLAFSCLQGSRFSLASVFMVFVHNPWLLCLSTTASTRSKIAAEATTWALARDSRTSRLPGLLS